MKVYSTGEVIDRRMVDGRDSEDWAPAEVAQGLYEALKRMNDQFGPMAWGDNEDEEEAIAQAEAALAAADGEEK